MILTSVLQLVWVFGLAFIPCELGERVKLEFCEISCVMNQFDWYRFPIEILPFLPIIMINVQQPVVVDCFGSIACTREVFKSVSLANKNFN